MGGAMRRICQGDVAAVHLIAPQSDSTFLPGV
jgi:hypothetical protein